MLKNKSMKLSDMIAVEEATYQEANFFAHTKKLSLDKQVEQECKGVGRILPLRDCCHKRPWKTLHRPKSSNIPQDLTQSHNMDSNQ